MSEIIDIKNLTKFSGANFQAWKFQMRAILVSNDILNHVEGIEEMPNDEARKKSWKKRDAKAMYFIIFHGAWSGIFTHMRDIR